MRDSALVYAEARLVPWAAWSRHHERGVGERGESNIYGMMRLQLSPKKPRVAVPLELQRVTARGKNSRAVQPHEVGEMDPAIVEVDRAVANIPYVLRTVIKVEFFADESRAVKSKQCHCGETRYRQLLESAKYAVYVALVCTEQ